MSTCSCATASLTGALSGVVASDNIQNSSKAAILIFTTPVALPCAVAFDLVAPVFIGMDHAMRNVDPEFDKKNGPMLKGGLPEFYNFSKNFNRIYSLIYYKMYDSLGYANLPFFIDIIP